VRAAGVVAAHIRVLRVRAAAGAPGAPPPSEGGSLTETQLQKETSKF